MRKSTLIYLTLIVGVLTWLLYNYHRSGPLDEERIEYCNELVSKMPESNQTEINQSINRFTDCLNNR
ncbi:MAG TPA: hypothetical protein ENK49_07335 [Gammaproteobacteria bacterium]|nr:hypothetical protein [Gammaproteobacteria bacterium]